MIKMNMGNLAEIIGIMMGDGNLYFTKRKHYQIRISGHKRDDRAYLLKWVKPLFQKTFEVNVYEKYHKTKNEMFICVNSNRVARILIKYGFPAGRKSINKIRIPKWILKNKIFLKRCVRGLIDTDGFVYPVSLEKSKYPRIGFVSSISTLRDSFSKAMKKLNFNISKWTLRKSGWTGNYSVGQCTITRKEDVIRYYKEIGFKNPKYIEDFNRFCKAPFV